jgi:glutamate synthase (NADPH/NADH) small chain
MRELEVPGGRHPAVIDALKFIAGYKTAGKLTVGRRVVVVGAGNTAIDAARAALRLGAEEVRILYRRGESSMSAFLFEYEQAKQEGVRFHWWAQPVAIAVSKDASRLEAIECVLTEPDFRGGLRQLAESRFSVPCDMVIPAIGQVPLLEFLRACRGVQVEGGLVVVDCASGQTSNAKYFAGGDCVNGGREVVDAVADGKRAACAAAKLLENSHG